MRGKVFGAPGKSVYRFGQRALLLFMVANSFSFAMLSHPGRVRKGNEDACAAAPSEGAFVVCDGMGGAAAGEVASRMATEVWIESLREDGRLSGGRASVEDRLESATRAANRAVFQHSHSASGLRGMGTTLVGLLLNSEGETGARSLTLAHVGDSRCYLWRGGVLSQLTDDHSLVEEQVRLGEITALEAASHPMRNIITRAVGSQATVVPDILRLDPRPGDLYLLASDGLTRELNDASIARLLGVRAGGKHPGSKAELDTICSALVGAANSAGGGDNITVLLLALS